MTLPKHPSVTAERIQPFPLDTRFRAEAKITRGSGMAAVAVNLTLGQCGAIRRAADARGVDIAFLRERAR